MKKMMNSRERISAALQRQQVDKIPIVNVFNLGYLKRQLNMKGNMIEKFLENPLDTIIKFQESIGHDPVFQVYTHNELTQIRWPGTVFKWPEKKLKKSGWDVTEEIIRYDGNNPIIKREYRTPSGMMTAYYIRDKCQNWAIEYPLKEETDIEILKHRPNPDDIDITTIENLIKKLDNRAFVFVGIPSVWHEACSMRGMDNMIFDLYDRPEWAKMFLGILKDHSVKLAKKLAETSIDCIMLNESSVGMGMSSEMFEEFIWPLDKEIMDEANRCGKLTDLHICGRCNNILERMTDMGSTCIEPLCPADYAGDIDLADAKQRVGHKVGLWGGFKERVLINSAEEVRQEALRCLDAAAQGGGYILRGAGQIFDAKIDNYKVLSDVVSTYRI
ncbi:MAG: uroporphyrinogen decarboxylase family protein [Clostridia bacterium]